MKKVRIIVAFIIFNLLLAAVLIRGNYILRNKDYSGAQDLFVKWNSEHADMVFIGNSHQFCSVDTDLLYDEYGIESFMLATSAQTVAESYYATMEAIELKHPDKIIFEAAYVANDFLTVTGEMTHCFFDGMPRCKARKLAIEDLIDEEERIYYYLPLGLYHVRWKELTEKDYGELDLSPRGTFTRTEVFENWDISLIEPDETEMIPESSEEYLLKLIDLCKSENVELIIYIAPFNGLYNDAPYVYDIHSREAMFNYTCELAREKGIPAYNLFYAIDEIGLDNATDWSDSQHLNKSGQEKLTRYIAENGILY